MVGAGATSKGKSEERQRTGKKQQAGALSAATKLPARPYFCRSEVRSDPFVPQYFCPHHQN
jgi:hypothetical protein